MIYVPISENTVHIGGPSTFLKNLAKYFNKKNICLAKNYNECKVIFFPISYNINVLKRLQRKYRIMNIFLYLGKGIMQIYL